MATYLGKNAVILVGTTSPPTTPLGKHFDAEQSQDEERHDSTTNDSGGSNEHEIGHDSGSTSGKFYTDRTDPGQVIVRNAKKNKTKIYVAIQEEGTGGGLPQDLFQASVGLKKGTPLRGLAVTNFTFTRSGAIDDTAQS